MTLLYLIHVRLKSVLAANHALGEERCPYFEQSIRRLVATAMSSLPSSPYSRHWTSPSRRPVDCGAYEQLTCTLHSLPWHAQPNTRAHLPGEHPVANTVFPWPLSCSLHLCLETAYSCRAASEARAHLHPHTSSSQPRPVRGMTKVQRPLPMMKRGAQDVRYARVSRKRDRSASPGAT